MKTATGSGKEIPASWQTALAAEKGRKSGGKKNGGRGIHDLPPSLPNKERKGGRELRGRGHISIGQIQQPNSGECRTWGGSMLNQKRTYGGKGLSGGGLK